MSTDLPAPVCVHDDGTEHVLERGPDGLFGCDLAALREAVAKTARDLALTSPNLTPAAALDLLVQASRCLAEWDEASLRVRIEALAQEWDEEAGDYVPPLPPDMPWQLMVDHAAALRALLTPAPSAPFPRRPEVPR